MLNSKKSILLLCWLLISVNALGFVPNRRRSYEDRDPNTYMFIPAIASLPGMGTFVGVLGSFSNIADSGIDAAITEAHTIESETDIHVRAYALREIPLYFEGLSFEYWFGNIKFTDMYMYLPGRNSPNYVIPYTGKFDYYFLRPAYRIWDRRINLTYNLVFFKGYGVSDDGKDEIMANHSASGNLLFDFTDDWVDPRRGLRIGYSFSMTPPEKSIIGENTEKSEDDEVVKTKSLNIGLYIPFGEEFTLALYQEIFEATGKEDSDEVVSGGSLNLRGYPQGRWSDRFGLMRIAEARWHIPTNWKLNWLIINGNVEDIQLAVFAEEGQVSPEKNSRLEEGMHKSYGVGIRALIDVIVLRFDIAASDEGTQTHLTIDHAF